jgi:hypothetical protein
MSCQNTFDDTMEESSLNYVKLSKDEDFNALIEILTKQQTGLSTNKDNSAKLEEWTGSNPDINKVDINEVSKVFGYRNVVAFQNDLKSLEGLSKKLKMKYPDLNKNVEMINNAVMRSPYFENMSNRNLRIQGCDRAMLGACMAGAYGAYVVVMTSNCPGAAVLEPWGVGACIAGATITYGAAIYSCGHGYGCNHQ